MKKIILLALAILCLATTASAAAVPFNGIGITDEGAVLTAPSAEGKVLMFPFIGKEEVKISGKYVSEDRNAAILNKDTSVWTDKLDQRVRSIVLEKGHSATVMLQRGHALQIVGEGSDFYRCKLTVGRADNVIYDFPKDVVKRVYGGVWYRIILDGMTGYIYSDYLKLK